jgi:hypothetical protein
VSKCDREASILRRPSRGLLLHEKKLVTFAKTEVRQFRMRDVRKGMMKSKHRNTFLRKDNSGTEARVWTLSLHVSNKERFPI